MELCSGIPRGHLWESSLLKSYWFISSSLVLHLFALQRGTGVAFRLRWVSVGAGKRCNQVSRIKSCGSPLFTLLQLLQRFIHTFPMTRSDVIYGTNRLKVNGYQAPHMRLRSERPVSQRPRSHLAGIMEHLPSTPDSFSSVPQWPSTLCLDMLQPSKNTSTMPVGSYFNKKCLKNNLKPACGFNTVYTSLTMHLSEAV